MKKKLISFVLSLTMIINGGSLINPVVAEAKTKSFSSTDSFSKDELDDESFVKEINGHEYKFDDEGAVIKVGNVQTSYLDYGSDAMRDLDVYYDDISIPEGKYFYDTPKEGEEIRIEKKYFGHGLEQGIFINEDLGNVNFDEILKTFDFVYLECLDFLNDKYDSNFEENAKECEEKGIPYGVVFIGDMNQHEYTDVAYNDFKTAKKILKKYSDSLPPILRVKQRKFEDGYERNSFDYGIYDFINSEDNYHYYDSIEYLNKFFEKKAFSSEPYFMLSLNSKTMEKLLNMEINDDDFGLNDINYSRLCVENENDFSGVFYKYSLSVKNNLYEIDGKEINLEKIYIPKDIGPDFYKLKEREKKDLIIKYMLLGTECLIYVLCGAIIIIGPSKIINKIKELILEHEESYTKKKNKNKKK